MAFLSVLEALFPLCVGASEPTVHEEDASWEVALIFLPQPCRVLGDELETQLFSLRQLLLQFNGQG